MNWILKLKWWIGCSLRSHRAHFIFYGNYLKTFKSICQIHCNIFDIGKWVGYWLTGFRYFRIRIHCILPTKHPTVVPLSGIVPIQFYIRIFLPLNIVHLGTSLMNQLYILLSQKGFFKDLLRGWDWICNLISRFRCDRREHHTRFIFC